MFPRGYSPHLQKSGFPHCPSSAVLHHPLSLRGDADLDSSTSREHATEIDGRPPYAAVEIRLLFQQTGKKNTKCKHAVFFGAPVYGSLMLISSFLEEG